MYTVLARARQWLTGSGRRDRLLCDCQGADRGREAGELFDGAVGEAGQQVSEVGADGDAQLSAALRR